MPYGCGMFEFIETPLFTRLVGRYLSDEEYAGLQAHLNARPDSGVLVPGSGGARKLRWALEGAGKSRGVRVIYYLRLAQRQIWMLTLYGKNRQTNIPLRILKDFRQSIEDE